MLPKIESSAHGVYGEAMAHAVHTCVHCGYCLPACPTYREFGQEMDSPRGRIVLMKQVLAGELSASAAQPHIDRCLGCLACEPACPSGIPYRELIGPYRATIAGANESRGGAARFRRWVAHRTVPYPARLRRALTLAQFVQPFRAVMPSAVKPFLDLAPRCVPASVHLPEFTPAIGTRRARVALLAGCAQQVLDPDINVATIDVLTRHGVEVLVPRAQGCCGGLAWHTGDLDSAQAFARQNLAAFPADIDAVVTNAAGCGSTLREYAFILRGTADAPRAAELALRAVDVSVFLARLGFVPPVKKNAAIRVAYHDACHLANAQGARAEPRHLLRQVPGLELVEITDPHLCCGSAGTYNMDQPETAASLGTQKARAVIATGAAVLASGNIGCLTQLRAHLQRLGSPIVVRHTVQILRDAYAEKKA